MSKARYKHLRSLMDHEKSMTKLLIEEGLEKHVEDLHKNYAEQIREYLRRIDREYIDQLEKPLTADWRTIVDDPDDIAISGYHYRILKTEHPDDWTDEEIKEFIMDEVGYPDICEPWDCTGKRFTSWVSWSRQPVGIVMIHRWGTDL